MDQVQVLQHPTVWGVEMEERTPRVERRRKLLAGDALQSYSVVSTDGNQIGDIEDVIVDLADGRITHLIVSYGDWLSSSSVMVPWQEMSLDAERDCFVLDAAAAQRFACAATLDIEA